MNRSLLAFIESKRDGSALTYTIRPELEHVSMIYAAKIQMLNGPGTCVSYPSGSNRVVVPSQTVPELYKI